VLLTFLAVVVAWVFFRASSLDAAIVTLKGMTGVNGISLPPSFAGIGGGVIAKLPPVQIEYLGLFSGVDVLSTLGGARLSAYLLISMVIVWILPNTQEIFARTHAPATRHDSIMKWKPNPAWMVWIGLLLGLSILSLHRTSEFLYFQF
jgi:hypothetical protein